MGWQLRFGVTTVFLEMVPWGRSQPHRIPMSSWSKFSLMKRLQLGTRHLSGKKIILPMDVTSILGSQSARDLWKTLKSFGSGLMKKGVFSVQSAYRMLVNTKMIREGWLFHEGGSSNSAAKAKDWTELWIFSVPSKLRIFPWRLSQHLMY